MQKYGTVLDEREFNQVLIMFSYTWSEIDQDSTAQWWTLSTNGTVVDYLSKHWLSLWMIFKSREHIYYIVAGMYSYSSSTIHFQELTHMYIHI